MPKNLRDFMNRNNITSSSRDSRQDMRQAGQPLGSGNSEPFGKFPKSREQCSQQMSTILHELDRKEADLKKSADGHNMGVLRKFSEDYDNLMHQIIRYVEMKLKENKDKIMRELKERRSVDMAECKPINRNIDQLRSEVISLRDGLSRTNEYRLYMSKIVMKDFEDELKGIQYEIDKVRFPTIDVRLDDKYNNCFKSDLDKIIIVKDEMSLRVGNKSNYGSEDINSHMNRDQIKRSKQQNYK